MTERQTTADVTASVGIRRAAAHEGERLREIASAAKGY